MELTFQILAWELELLIQHTMSRTASAIYGGFYKPAWALSVGWVIFACCRGYGGTRDEVSREYHVYHTIALLQPHNQIFFKFPAEFLEKNFVCT